MSNSENDMKEPRQAGECLTEDTAADKASQTGVNGGSDANWQGTGTAGEENGSGAGMQGSGSVDAENGPAPGGEASDTAKGPLAFVREKFRWKVIRFIFYFLTTFFVIAGRSAQWMLEEWGDLSFDEVVFTMTQPLKGTDTGIISGYIVYAVVPGIIVLAVLMVCMHLFLLPKQPPKNKKTRIDGVKTEIPVQLTEKQSAKLAADWAKKNTPKRRFFRRWTQPVAALIAVVFGVIEIGGVWNKLGISERISSLGQESTWIEDNYVDPASTTLTFPTKKRNLIYIFLESMEMSYSDKKSGGLFDDNYIPNLTKLSEENENFSGSDDKLNGGNALKYSTWTMGGMFAATSGLPLKIPIEINGVGTNFMNTQDSFFPNLTCLGDILQQQGYSMNMMFGSDATFGGRRLCFSEHGNYDFYDWVHYTTDGELPSGYKVWWGFEDEKLFKFAKDRLNQLAETSDDQPFALTMLTVDTHYPDGYVCDLCDDKYAQQYANVVACSDRQVSEFIKWCQQQPWYDNTTIILSGDHPTMNKTFCASASYDYERKVYTAYINAPVKPVRNDYREFATVDNFPTTLAALGVKIDGNRLGLGTNLFSDQDTLIERDGLDYVNTELQKTSKWMDEQSNLKQVTADIEYGDYDPDDHSITMKLSNVTSDQVDGFKASLHMYGYIVNGKDYVSWTESTEDDPGVYTVKISIPVDQAFDGRIKIQPHCMIKGVRGIHLDTHYYHLKYDAGGGNAEAYQCDKYGEKLKSAGVFEKIGDWFKNLIPA